MVALGFYVGIGLVVGIDLIVDIDLILGISLIVGIEIFWDGPFALANVRNFLESTIWFFWHPNFIIKLVNYLKY